MRTKKTPPMQSREHNSSQLTPRDVLPRALDELTAATTVPELAHELPVRRRHDPARRVVEVVRALAAVGRVARSRGDGRLQRVPGHLCFF